MITFFLMSILAAAFVIGWWLVFAPAARYLAPSVPLLLVPMAEALRYRAVRFAIAVLLVPQAVIDAVIWQHPRWMWPAPEGNVALHSLGLMGRMYGDLLVNVQNGASLFPALWIGAALAIASATVAWLA